MTATRQCDHWTEDRTTRPRSGWRRRPSHRCEHPARFRVRGMPAYRGGPPGPPPYEGEYACGMHVRPALMDNGDSARWPWLVEPLGTEVPTETVLTDRGGAPSIAFTSDTPREAPAT